jgi:hypothetical protein
MVRKLHAWKRRAGTCTKAKMTRIYYVIIFKAHLDYFRITFSNSLTVVDILREFWVLTRLW